VAYYDHRHNGINETNILQAVKQAEGETVTSLVQMEMTESYSINSFLMALRKFTTIHRAPRRFQSDQGDQLIAASKQLATWDWSKVDDVQPEGCHLEASADWRPALQLVNKESDRAAKAVPGLIPQGEELFHDVDCHCAGRGSPGGEQPPNSPRSTKRRSDQQRPHHPPLPAGEGLDRDP
jgi:hypothetical protein